MSKASTVLSTEGGDQIPPWPGQLFSLQAPERATAEGHDSWKM